MTTQRGQPDLWVSKKASAKNAKRRATCFSREELICPQAFSDIELTGVCKALLSAPMVDIAINGAS